MFALLKRFCGDRRAAIAVYSAYAGTLLIGACALGIDIGRLGIIRTQMQNAADSAALAAAAQLNGLPNALERAEDVAKNAASQTSGLLDSGGTIVVQDVSFSYLLEPYGEFQAFTPDTATIATVDLAIGETRLLFRPILDLLAGTSESNTTTMTARAKAINEPIACMPVPLMVCLSPGASSQWSLMDSSMAGRMVAFRERTIAGGGHVASFRLVCPPDIPDCSEAEAEEYATQVSANQCVTNPLNQIDVTSPVTVEDGINVRFGNTTEAADNVVYYDRDPEPWQQGDPTTTGAWNLGDWPIDDYWLDKHGVPLPGGHPLDDAAGTSRYQVYLYELGQAFAKNGRQTIYPLPATMPSGFHAVYSTGDADIPEDNSDFMNNAVDGFPNHDDSADPNPQPDPGSVDPMRRVITAALGLCPDQPGVYWTGRYLQLFLTEEADGYTIFTELIGPMDEVGATNYIPNVRLLL